MGDRKRHHNLRVLIDTVKEEIVGGGLNNPLTKSVRTTIGIKGTTAFKASKHTANHAARPTNASKKYHAYRDKWFSLTTNDCDQAIDNYFKFREGNGGLTVHDERAIGRKLLTKMKSRIQKSDPSDLAEMLQKCSGDKEFCTNGQRGRIYLVKAFQTLEVTDIMSRKAIRELLATTQTALFLLELMRDVVWQQTQEPEETEESEY
ncbi:MAG: hypothetical protein Q9167_002920 [Letrouitia subvulpina]